MKKFLLKIILLCLIISIITLTLEILLRDIPNDYSYKKKYLDKHSNEIQTLIFGYSHSFWGIDPEYFRSRAFNVSHVSQSLDYDYAILKKYQDNLNDLKTIVLPISYNTLFYDLMNSVESWRVKNYIIYYKTDTPCSISDHFEVLSNQLRVNLKRIFLYYIKKETNVTCTGLGWCPNYKSASPGELQKSGEIAARRHTIADIHSSDETRIFQEHCQIISFIIEWSLKRNVRVLFVTLPAYKTYRENLNEEQLNMTTSAIEKMILYKKNCRYVNLLNDTTFKANDFYDADHLNTVGAKKLSLMLDEIVSDK